MAEWKKEIKALIGDFNIPQNYKDVIRETEKSCREVETPSFYKGNREAFLYDRAYARIRPYIFA